MSTPASPARIRCGFLPLTDAAILVVAREKGFAADEDIALELIRETSWANIRDRMAVGHFHVAHMLAPMPIAAALGLTPLELAVFAPMSLGLGGNAVTVSSSLWDELVRDGGLAATTGAAASVSSTGAKTPAGIDNVGDAYAAGVALARVLQRRRASGGRPPTFAVVHPFSGHNYELRYWLAASGIDPDRDLTITMLPPSFMPDALASGQIDGCCVGEPWNSAAVAFGAGRILTTKSAIWRCSPEKVLGVRTAWAAEQPDALQRLLRACYRAALWCDNQSNLDELARLLAEPRYLAVPAATLLPGLTDRIAIGTQAARPVADFHLFAAKAATFPWTSHALWFYSQMIRWGQTALSPAGVHAARQSYRPDLYRRAIQPLGVVLPETDEKVEGNLTSAIAISSTEPSALLGPDGFFDGIPFDPTDIAAYLRTLSFSGTVRS